MTLLIFSQELEGADLKHFKELLDMISSTDVLFMYVFKMRKRWNVMIIV
jgi:hypothetical protein